MLSSNMSSLSSVILFLEEEGFGPVDSFKEYSAFTKQMSNFLIRVQCYDDNYPCIVFILYIEEKAVICGIYVVSTSKSEPLLYATNIVSLSQILNENAKKILPVIEKYTETMLNISEKSVLSFTEESLYSFWLNPMNIQISLFEGILDIADLTQAKG